MAALASALYCGFAFGELAPGRVPFVGSASATTPLTMRGRRSFLEVDGSTVLVSAITDSRLVLGGPRVVIHVPPMDGRRCMDSAPVQAYPRVCRQWVAAGPARDCRGDEGQAPRSLMCVAALTRGTKGWKVTIRVGGPFGGLFLAGTPVAVGPSDNLAPVSASLGAGAAASSLVRASSPACDTLIVRFIPLLPRTLVMLLFGSAVRTRWQR